MIFVSQNGTFGTPVQTNWVMRETTVTKYRISMSQATVCAPGDEGDQALLRQIAQGDTQALEELYQRHGRALLSYLIGQIGSPAAAEDLLQEVMLAVWQGAPQFRAESKVTTWLLSIAHHRAVTARQRLPSAEGLLHENIAAESAGPPEMLERQADRVRVQAALQQLPPDQRAVLELIFYHDLSGPEAAEVLGVSIGTVKSRLHRAKTRLGRLLRLGEDL
jgi:RNA polymerase sigma-70 factor (ECF subfamily)